MCVDQPLWAPGLGSRCLGPGGRPGVQEESGTPGEEADRWQQVLWPVADAELKAESPRGLETAFSLKTPEAKRPG